MSFSNLGLHLSSVVFLSCLAVFWSAGQTSGQLVGTVVAEGLKTHAPQNFFIGGVVHGDASFKNASYRAVAEREFNAVTSTAYMPWGVWENPKQNPNFSNFNAVVDWARQSGIQVHGHAMVYPWANAQSDWWKRIPISLVPKYLKHYVNSAAKTRRGQIWSWEAMGAGYIDQAFLWANAADPNAKLILNTTGCERICGKSDRLYRYALKLKARGFTESAFKLTSSMLNRLPRILPACVKIFSGSPTQDLNCT